MSIRPQQQSNIYSPTKDLTEKMQFLIDHGFDMNTMNHDEIDQCYELISKDQFENKPTIKKKTIVSSVVTTPKQVERKLTNNPARTPSSSSVNTKKQESTIEISTKDMRDILQLCIDTNNMSDSQVEQAYRFQFMQEFDTCNKVNVCSTTSTAKPASCNSSLNLSSPKTEEVSTKSPCRRMIEDKFEQLVIDVNINRNLLSAANNNKTNISIDDIVNYLVDFTQQNGGLSDLQYEFLEKVGYFGHEGGNSNPVSNDIQVTDGIKTYRVKNAGYNIGNGACGINWIPLAIRLGLLTMTQVEINLFGIDENADKNNVEFRKKIMHLYGFRGAKLKNASRKFTSGEDISSALFEFDESTFCQEGYYISAEQVYAIALMLGIRIKILIWDRQQNRAVVHLDQTQGYNKESIYLYLWCGHYYLMKRSE